MGLRFILGRAGTGKTATCLAEISGWLKTDPVAGGPLILLVPEQASFQMEKALLSRQPGAGLMRAQVMSFRRLGWLVFQEAGGTSRQYLDEVGKMMLLRSLLLEEKSLTIFHHLVREPGFVAKLAGTLKEFKSYNVTPADLWAQHEKVVAGGGKDGVLARKLHDLALLYEKFEASLAVNHTDPDDYLNLLAERIPLAPSLREARVWVDAFAGFTPQELKVLGSLMAHTRQVNVALCLDPQQLEREVTEMDLFHPTLVTYRKLVELAEKLAVTIEAPKILPESARAPRFANPALAFLEKHYQEPQISYAGVPADLRLVSAATRRAEVEGAAREIQRLAREKGYRYRDMAVILRDLSLYGELVATVFEEYGIPYFMDMKRPVTHHPLVELIISALETVNTYWSYEPLFRYLKTDLVPIGRREVDQLENYVLRYGLRGSRWLQEEPWSYGFEDTAAGQEAQERINRWREQGTAALKGFHRQLMGRRRWPVQRITAYLYQLLRELQVPQTLERWCREAEARGEPEKALEHKQVWDQVVDLLDQLVTALGRQEMDLPEYAKVLEAGLQHLKLGLIPPALDQVLVGSLDRSRQPELKGAFILGLNEGVFPARVKEDEIFNDREREELARNRLELAPTSRLSLFHEEYLAYIAFTRASEYLWLSYPKADEAGKELMPSPLVHRVRNLFPELPVESLSGEPGQDDFPVMDYLVNGRKAISCLAEQFRRVTQGEEIPPLWFTVYNHLLGYPELRERMRRVLAALFYRNAAEPLEEAVVASLFRRELKTSVSRLEAFAACPFRYFLQYSLKLQERQQYRVDAPLVGTFYHRALQLLVTQIREKGLAWGDLPEEELVRMTRGICAQLLPEMEHGVFLSSAAYRHRMKLVEQNLLAAVNMLTRHARLKTFAPVAVELPFGEQEGPALEISLEDGIIIKLQGRIDRVDAARIQDRYYLRVIDYKSGSRQLDLGRCYYGLSLQLPVYLDVALSNYRYFLDAPPLEGGMFYFPVKSPLLRLDEPPTREEAEKELRKALKMQGWILKDPELARSMGAAEDLINARLTTQGEFYKGAPALNREQFAVLRHFTRRKIKSLARQIYRGETAIAPYRIKNETACRYCGFKACCQFDSLIEGNGYRFLQPLPAEQALASMSREVEGGERHEQGSEMDSGAAAGHQGEGK